jgi:16S rRNA G966 N2-methylase RsmD
VASALARLPAGRFSLAFVDPPYADGPEAALQALPPLLAPGARVVAEHAAKRPPPEAIGPLGLLDRRAYGDTGISIYQLG